MGLCRAVDEEDSVLSLFAYSLSQDWGRQSSPSFLPHCPQGWERGAASEGAERHRSPPDAPAFSLSC